jgi:hypothetical protein
MATRARRGIFKPKHIAKHQQKHYWPYLPVLAIFLALLVLNLLQPIKKFGVLAYSTEMSRDQLLSSTNDRRAQNGVKNLSLNAQLNAAAQAKANDMVARNYWSHNTPDGQEPWVFISNAGYKYLKAGENLAYGFSTSDATVTGWMNSPSHRENLLDSSYIDVGFGFANGENYNNSGPETVVVAEYGRPQVLADSTPSAPTSQPAPKKPAPAPAQESSPPNSQTPALQIDLPVSTAHPAAAEPASRQVARVQGLSSGAPAWTVFLTGALTGLFTAILLIKHAVGFRRIFKRGEKFVLHHPIIDLVMVCLILLGSFLLQTVGVIK